MQEAVIIDAVRTPGGRRNGKLKDQHPAALAGHVLKAIADITWHHAMNGERVRRDPSVVRALRQRYNNARLSGPRGAAVLACARAALINTSTLHNTF